MVKYCFTFGISFFIFLNYKSEERKKPSYQQLTFSSDEEEFEDWEKFISFHVSVVHANPYNEIDFDSFVTLYQLLEPLYRSPRMFLF